MLQTLHIENVATIASLETDFGPGLNLLTGETGAGKSILIDAIQAVSGAKVSRELIRTDAPDARVSALFCDVPPEVNAALEDFGASPEPDGTLLLQRKILRDGRNLCYVNGSPVTVSVLKSLCACLVHIHGQRDTSALLDPTRHLRFLDEFAGTEKELSDYLEAFENVKRLDASIKALTLDEGAKARQLDLLRFQIGELEAAAVVPGEVSDLKRRRSVLHNALKVQKALSAALSALLGSGEGEAGADALLSLAAGEVLGVTNVAKELAPLAESLLAARETVLDAGSVLDDVLRQLSENADDIDKIEERLDLLYRLSKKYGATEEEMLSFLESAKKQMDDVVFSEEKLAALEAERKEAQGLLAARAAVLTEKRAAAALLLQEKTQEELRFLDMPNAVFSVVLTKTPFTERGENDAQFFFSANPGEEPKPLEKAASGGEISRVMLSLKNVLGSAGGASTLIFDEIDSGVSGAAAGKIALKLASLSRSAQVLCVTHSAQIAAFADRHLYIYKEVRGGKTYSGVRPLEGEERARELARITYGEDPAPGQVAAAAQMIETAEEKKDKR